MNLLENAKEIAQFREVKSKKIFETLDYSIDICSALVKAMEEIEKIELHRNNDYQRAYTAGFETCKSILRKHLEVEK